MKQKRANHSSAVDRKEYLRQKAKEHYQKTKETKLKSVKEHYQKNREAVLESRKERHRKNREAGLESMKEYYQKNRSKLESRTEYHKRNREYRKDHAAARQEEMRTCIHGTRVNFTNTNSHHHIAMSPGEGVDRHFDCHPQDCPEANAILNHITTYRNHYTGNPDDPQEYIKLRDQIRAQYITPEKQREVAEKFLLSQGRGCSWAGEGGKTMFLEGKSRDALILGCACCGRRVKDCDNSYTKEPLSELEILKLSEDETKEHLQRIKDYNVDLPSNNAGQLKTYNLFISNQEQKVKSQSGAIMSIFMKHLLSRL